jgi:sulfite exporter TauE/SafE
MEGIFTALAKGIGISLTILNIGKASHKLSAWMEATLTI